MECPICMTDAGRNGAALGEAADREKLLPSIGFWSVLSTLLSDKAI